MKASEDLPAKGEHLGVFCPPGPPAYWGMHGGRWAWLPDGGPWQVVSDAFGFSVRVPRLAQPPPPAPLLQNLRIVGEGPFFDRLRDVQKYSAAQLRESEITRHGRPRLRDTDPAALRRMAFEIDLAGESRRGYARRHGVYGDDARTTVRHRLNQARALLADEGALPWAAWPQGKLPIQWWESSVFMAAIEHWIAGGVSVQRHQG